MLMVDANPRRVVLPKGALGAHLSEDSDRFSGHRSGDLAGNPEPKRGVGRTIAEPLVNLAPSSFFGGGLGFVGLRTELDCKRRSLTKHLLLELVFQKLFDAAASQVGVL